MMRLLLAVTLLASTVALAADQPKTQQTGTAVGAKKKTEVAKKVASAHKTTAPVQKPAEDAQAKNEETQAQAEGAQAKTDEPAKLTSVPDAKALGISILGNQDAPKSLVIVPWKTSELGETPGISPMLDDSRQPVDKEVFMRSLRYYEIRSKSK